MGDSALADLLFSWKVRRNNKSTISYFAQNFKSIICE